MCDYEKEEAIRRFLNVETDKCDIESSLLEDRKINALERKLELNSVYSEIVNKNIKDVKTTLEKMLRCDKVPRTAAIINNLIAFIDKLDGEIPEDVVARIDGAGFSMYDEKSKLNVEDKAQEKAESGVRSASLFLYESIKELNNFSPIAREAIICALHGYFITAPENERCRDLGLFHHK